MVDSLNDEFQAWLEESKKIISEKFGASDSDLRWLLADALKDPNWWSRRPSDVQIDKESFEKAKSFVHRRLQGEPVAYILGEWEFYGIPIIVGPGVLVPRPETELIVDLVKQDYNLESELIAADFGSGSGCLARALCSQFSHLQVDAIEKSPRAFEYLKKNTQSVPRIKCVQATIEEMMASETELRSLHFDFIVANPPYIDESDEHTADDVRMFEPKEALFAASQGTASIASWLDVAAIALKPGGRYYFEIGFQQKSWVVEHIESHSGWELERIENDLAGHPRIVVVRKVEG